MSSEVRRGWRYFECDECGLTWKSATRDRHSHSGEDCECGEFLRPVKQEMDADLPCDEMGNMMIPYEQITVPRSELEA